MTSIEAKQMLLTYRPWADEAERAEFAEALALCRQDTELGRWFENHCAVQNAVRARLKGVPVPGGLKEQILAERNVRAPIIWLKQPAWLAAVAAVVIIAVTTGLWRTLQPPKEDVSFAAFQARMVGTALRSYGMDFEATNATQIRAYLATQQANSDYTLPNGLTQAPNVGCGVLSWQNNRVTMICFRTGRQLKPGDKSDLFLFVMARSAVPNPPPTGTPEISNVKNYATARWSDGEKIYLLASPGDEANLRRFL